MYCCIRNRHCKIINFNILFNHILKFSSKFIKLILLLRNINYFSFIRLFRWFFNFYRFSLRSTLLIHFFIYLLTTIFLITKNTRSSAQLHTSSSYLNIIWSCGLLFVIIKYHFLTHFLYFLNDLFLLKRER